MVGGSPTNAKPPSRPVNIKLAATSAVVDTAGTGTVRLPYAPMQVAFDPRGAYALVATLGGVSAWVFDGQAVRPVAGWSLGNLAGATDAAWVMRGRAFTVSTASKVAVYGLSARAGGYDATRVAVASVNGTLGLAPGPAALPCPLPTNEGLTADAGWPMVRTWHQSGSSSNGFRKRTQPSSCAAHWHRSPTCTGANWPTACATRLG